MRVVQLKTDSRAFSANCHLWLTMLIEAAEPRNSEGLEPDRRPAPPGIGHPLVPALHAHDRLGRGDSKLFVGGMSHLVETRDSDRIEAAGLQANRVGQRLV